MPTSSNFSMVVGLPGAAAFDPFVDLFFLKFPTENLVLSDFIWMKRCRYVSKGKAGCCQIVLKRLIFLNRVVIHRRIFSNGGLKDGVQYKKVTS